MGWRSCSASSRVAVGEFELAAQAVVVTSGGIGADHQLVRPLLRELMLGEQRHYDHPQLSRDEIEHDVAQAPAARFSGEK